MSGSFLSVIPPRPYTFMCVFSQISRRNTVPFPGSPFLQSVSKILPAVTYCAPFLSACSASSRVCTDTPTQVKVPGLFSHRIKSSKVRWILGQPAASAAFRNVWHISLIPLLLHTGIICSASFLYAASSRSFSRRIRISTLPSSLAACSCREQEHKCRLDIAMRLKEDIVVHHRLQAVLPNCCNNLFYTPFICDLKLIVPPAAFIPSMAADARADAG